MSGPRHSNFPVLIAAALLALGTGLLLLADPLVLAPQLDAKENLLWAARFDAWELPPEPLYRAVLYPLVLSLLHPAGMRPLLGALLGLACHLLNGWLVHRIAGRFWQREGAAVLAAVLYLLNPASLFFALQLVDITFATTLFLGGLALGLRRGGAGALLGCGALLGLAVLARPNFLPLALLVPATLMLLAGSGRRRAALAWAPLAALLLLQGLLNLRLAGEFRVLPWQGAYNLWAANRPGANGLYFQQTVDVAARGDDDNPTRAESILLYAQAHPDAAPPFSIGEMNRYWVGRFREHVLAHPGEAARLWLFKAYAVLNSFEQYNNLTFSFHKARIPPLRHNPHNWGVLLALGAAGLVVLAGRRPRAALVVTLWLLAGTLPLVLYYASGNFRLPLVPLLAVAGGGIVVIARDFNRLSPRLRAAAAAAAVSAAAAAYSSFGDIRSDATHVQDELLLANAHADLGQDLEAARRARSVLERQPLRREALRIYAVSYFNLRLLRDPAAAGLGGWQEQRRWVRQRPPTDPVQDAVLGVFLWRWGHPEDARDAWRLASAAGAAGSALARSCLRLTGAGDRPQPLSPLESALADLFSDAHD